MKVTRISSPLATAIVVLVSMFLAPISLLRSVGGDQLP